MYQRPLNSLLSCQSSAHISRISRSVQRLYNRHWFKPRSSHRTTAWHCSQVQKINSCVRAMHPADQTCNLPFCTSASSLYIYCCCIQLTPKQHKICNISFYLTLLQIHNHHVHVRLNFRFVSFIFKTSYLYLTQYIKY